MIIGEDPQLFYLALTALATAVLALLTAISALFLRWTVKVAAKGQQAQIFLELSRYYNEIYYKRNRLLQKPITEFDYDRLMAKYGSVSNLMNSDEWRDIRDVAACFELIGVLVKRGYIRKEVLFDMILVDPPAEPAAGEVKLWDKAERFVKRAREKNRFQWRNWEYLVREERKIYGKLKNSKHVSVIYSPAAYQGPAVNQENILATFLKEKSPYILGFTGVGVLILMATELAKKARR